jgi:hypothetical protein
MLLLANFTTEKKRETNEELTLRSDPWAGLIASGHEMRLKAYPMV